MLKLKHQFLALLLFCALTTTAQKYTATKGEISFTSNAILELIKASSSKVQGVLDTSTGQFAFLVKVQSFEGFNSNLQREHFNEKYLETDKFYDATFTGKLVEDIDFSKEGTYDVTAKGTLVIHGKKQPRTITGKITVEKGKIKIDSDFKVLLADHDIKIPTIISEKVATEIYIKLMIWMAPK
ncbi:MAG: YceI family protein [Bacteroidetes bacterium]|nr:YceI family protein [Bacteroidota bacterium]